MYDGRMLARRTLLAALVAASMTPLAACGSPAATDTLDVDGFAKLVATPEVVVLDVRTPAEFAEGHLANAVLMDVNAGDFAAKAAKLDKDKTYAVYCCSGNRSATALKIMKDAGVTKVSHLGQGFNAWKAAGKPVVR